MASEAYTQMHKNVKMQGSQDWLTRLLFLEFNLLVFRLINYGYLNFYAPEGTSGGILKSHRPSVRLSVRPLQIVSQRYLINY